MRYAVILLSSMTFLAGCVPVIGTIGVAGTRVVSQERTAGGAVDDLTMEANINNRFFKADVNDLFKNIDVDVIEGRAFLTGNVKENATMMRAVELAWEAAGVREVINEIQVENTSGVKDAANDIWIEMQIEGELLITKNIHSVNYNVECVNGIVTLMGIAQDAGELERVTAIASRVAGVKQVVSHVIMKDDPRRNAPKAPATNTSTQYQNNVDYRNNNDNSAQDSGEIDIAPLDGSNDHIPPSPTSGYYD